jgi:two-component SAPR family response regulator
MIISDYNMQKLNGVELIEKIKERINRTNLKHPKYIISTTDVFFSDEEELKILADDYLPKPVSIDTIDRYIRKYLL